MPGTVITFQLFRGIESSETRDLDSIFNESGERGVMRGMRSSRTRATMKHPAWSRSEPAAMAKSLPINLSDFSDVKAIADLQAAATVFGNAMREGANTKSNVVRNDYAADLSRLTPSSHLTAGSAVADHGSL